ncbi:hypothetical protein CP978_17635 [Streptomyces nodosus]|uniref:WXG100 family type VII secretion target n=3 Tax=Streptomyces TaxID=1883 RepID=A0A5P2W2I0_9ACTN|nr:hypothetical protein CP978_17635 [Streptomyces nodosus]
MSGTGMEGTPGQPVGMRLNQIPADPGTGGGTQTPDLASSPEAKKKAANSIEQNIEPATRKAGDVADGSTDAAVKAFGPKDAEGWLTSGALKSAHGTWGEQVKALLDRLGGEKQSLRAANTVFSGTDLQIGTGVKGVRSPLDTY